MTATNRWLDAAAIAALLSLSPRQVRERVALRPDFPRPVRVGGVGHPRWVESEVLAWMARQERARAA